MLHILSSDKMCILSVDLNNVNLDYANFDEGDPEIIIHVRLSVIDRQRKACKKYVSKELMPAVCHPTRWLDWCIPEDEKKEQTQFLLIKISIKLRSTKQLTKFWQGCGKSCQK